MKILVLSDSHGSRGFARRCIEALEPDAIIHLGDYYDDGEVLREEYPQIPMYQVPGNCDRYRCNPDLPEILIQSVSGVTLYVTHGHRHRVKTHLGALLRDARACGADAVLYGHTHQADCRQEPDGLWILNPGSCGCYGGSVGILRIRDGMILDCRILRERDLRNL